MKGSDEANSVSVVTLSPKGNNIPSYFQPLLHSQPAPTRWFAGVPPAKEF